MMSLDAEGKHSYRCQFNTTVFDSDYLSYYWSFETNAEYHETYYQAYNHDFGTNITDMDIQ